MKKLAIIILAVTASIGLSAAAQDATPLPFDAAAIEAQSQGALLIGGSADAEFTPETAEHWWTLPLHAGDTIFLTVNADMTALLYPRVDLFNPEGVLVAQDANAVNGHNVLISNFSAQQDGTHYLRVAPVTRAAGAYTLRVGRLPATPEGQPTPTPFVAAAPTFTPTEEVQPTIGSPTDAPTSPPIIVPPATTAAPALAGNLLALGQTVEAALPAGERHIYNLDAAGGLPVRIDLVGLQASPAALDPLLELYAPGGQFLYANDDWDFGLLDARLEVTLPSTGVYAIVVRSAGDRSGGTYSLTVRVGALWEP